MKRHAQLFLKRLRKALAPRRIRYFLVGEYGDETQRPHYHAIIFGWWPEDAKPHSSNGGHPLYTSGALTAAWGLGHVTFGSVTPESCAYTAAYCVKKITGPAARAHYTRITLSGQMIEVPPEFALMSTGRVRGGGIGGGFRERYRAELDAGDSALLGGRKVRMPRYYDRLLQAEAPERLQAVKQARKARALAHRENNTPERLATREEIATHKARANRKENIK